jgi:glutamate/tyrosine decarboxylase-like PLP-dependent enzyme
MTDLESPSILDLDRATMQTLGHRVTDMVAEHLSALRTKPAFTGITRAEAERLIAAPPPEQGADFETILATLQERVFKHAALEPHPGFIAYVPSCPTFPGVLGDWLTTGYNFFGGAWQIGGGPSEVELVVLEWLRSWIGMPAGASGLLTGGGSGANLTAMVAARHAAVGDEPERITKLTVYLSDQSHSSVERAAWMAGISRRNVRLLPCDADFRLDVKAAAAAIAADRAAGSSPRKFVTGLGRADSVTMDPHKWLYVPFECGCLLAKDPSKLKAAFQILPDYLKDVATSGGEVNFADYGEQLSRMARGIKVWLNVQYYGMQALSEAIAYSLALAPLAESEVRKNPELEVLAPATLGILCFRAVPRGVKPEALDELNERILRDVNASGKFFISSTRVRGAFSLRICPIGHRTRRSDMIELIEMVSQLAKTAGSGKREAPRETRTAG